MNERGKEGTRKCATRVSPLGMPLDADNEVILGVKLNRLNNIVFRRSRRHTKIVSRDLYRLVMTRIHKDRQPGWGYQLLEARAGNDTKLVSLVNLPSGSMIDG